MTLLSWGSNSHGQLGLGFQSEQETIPRKSKSVSKSNRLTQITGGGIHTLAVTEDNQILSCGESRSGEVTSNPNLRVPCEFQLICLNPFLQKVTKISCGWDFSLVLLESGDVYGWGLNTFGQLGVSSKTVQKISIPQKIVIENCVDLATGLRHSCLVKASGKVFCSGSNSKGQLGLGVDFSLRKVDTFLELPRIHGVTKIACGETFTLALTKTGDIFAWGDNKFGQLGEEQNTLKNSFSPKLIILPKNTSCIKDIFCGWTHCSLLTDDGCVICWGRGDYGQLGEKHHQTWKPDYLPGDLRFEQLSVGSEHTVGLTKTGVLLSWGWNEHGNCGTGTTENVWSPLPVGVPLNFNPAVIGSGYGHSFAFDIPEGLSERIPCDNTTNQDVLRLSVSSSYKEFFAKCLLRNEPCVVENAAKDWESLKKWVSRDGKPDTEHLRLHYGNAQVAVANCGKKVYNVQEKNEQTVSQFCDYWKLRDADNCERLYLKDWHFTRDFPDHPVYRVPNFFASDWLNEYYDNHPHLNDDYRFVYIGAKGTWTPLHADVFTSYSWSINVVGKKKWMLLRPGVEDRFRDKFGNLLFDEQLDVVAEPGAIYNLVQGPTDAIFIPSGWHHQVWNMEDTISINHNWVNGCNIDQMWKNMQKTLQEVENEIADCKDMELWDDHCQLMLRAQYGFNYNDFGQFLVSIIEARISALTSDSLLTTFGSWRLGLNHQLFDLRQAYKVLGQLVNACHLKQVKISCDPSGVYMKLKEFLNQDSFRKFS